MKKALISMLALCFAAAACMTATVYTYGETPTEEPQVEGSCAMVYCATTDQVLYEKNPDEMIYSASVIKLLTAIIAYEELGMDAVITVTEEAVDTPEYRLPLYEGETVTSSDLLHAALMMSSNDAAEALGIAVAGSKSAFTERMWQKLEELGCDGTVPDSASGVNEWQEKTTARDVITFAQKAYAIDELREISGKITYDFPKYSDKPERKVKNTNRFLKNSMGAGRNNTAESNIFYDGVVAGKTGTAGERDAAMVVYYSKDGLDLYAVILGTTNEERYNDMGKLLDYGVSRIGIVNKITKGEDFGLIPLKNGATNKVRVVASDSSRVIVPVGYSKDMVSVKISYDGAVSAPISEGDRVGAADVFLGDEKVDTVDIVAGESIDKGWFLSGLGVTNRQTLAGGIFIFCIVVIVLCVSALRSGKDGSRRSRNRNRRA